MSERLSRNRFHVVLFLSACFMTFALLAASVATRVNGASLDSSLIDKRNYGYYWATVDKTYITPLDDGGYMTFVVNSDNSGYTVDYYDKLFNHLSTKKISAELGIFGSFYSDSNGYYVLSGQKNPDESADVECYRLTKYDKSWNRKGACGLKDCNTYIPFDAGSASIASTGNYLVIRTCHEMYADEGVHHQANVSILVNSSTMTILDSFYDVYNTSVGYVSHSFNQYVRIDNNHIIGVDHGDAHPRSICMFYYKTDVTTGKLLKSGVTMYEPIKIGGEYSALHNYTGATLGGLEVSSSNYIIVGSSIDQSDSSTKKKNIYVSTVNKSTGKTSTTWLTSDAENNGDYSNPYIVKISNTSFAVIWSRDTTVYYAFIDGSGALQGTVKSATGKLSDCQPVLSGNKIVWFNNNTIPDFFYIDTTDKSFHQLYQLTLGSTTNGTASIAKTRAEAGEQVKVTYTPEDGYVLDAIKLNGTAITGDTIDMPAKNSTVAVSFKLREYDINPGKIENGGIAISKTKAHVDEVVELEALPNEGYELDYFTVNDEPIAGDTFKMPKEDVKVVAVFKPIDYTVTVSDTVNGMASVDKSIANIGNKITVEYTPAKCYQLDTIKVNGKVIDDNIFTMPAADVTVDVTFKEKPHTIVPVDGKEPKCTQDGYEPYYKCTECGKLFSDHDGKTVISAPVAIKKLGHDLKLVKELAPTKESAGHWAYYECQRCHLLFKDKDGKTATTLEAETIPQMKHDLTLVPAKAATCTRDGNKSYYECQDPDCGCGECFSDAYGLNKIDKSTIVVKATGHDLKNVAAVPPTCTADGSKEHWKCSKCGALFEDKDGKKPITTEDTVDPALGHDIDHLEHHAEIPATRDNDGVKEYFVCPRCGKKFKDSTCKTEMTDKDLVIPAIGAAKPGEVADDGDFRYQVTYAATNGTGTVTLVGLVNESENVSIPATAVIKETTYIVNRIGYKAFCNDKNIKTLYINSNITAIDNYAFYGCSNLVKVSGGYNLRTIGSYSFAGCPKLSSFKLSSKVLAKIGTYCFKSDSKLKTIYIKSTTKLTKKGVKKSLKGSKVKTVKVKKSKVRKYRKYFTKKNCGRKVKVKK